MEPCKMTTEELIDEFYTLFNIARNFPNKYEQYRYQMCEISKELNVRQVLRPYINKTGYKGQGI
jgi:TolB-like protein